MPAPAAQDISFTGHLDSHQSRLLAYLLALTGNRTEAADLLQMTNLVLWRKADRFEEGTSFSAWAFQVARYEYLSWRQRKGRDRLVFDETLLQHAPQADAEEHGDAERHAALDDCLPKLPDRQRDVITRRYLRGERVDAIGEAMGLPGNAVSQILWRARQNLLECINHQLAAPAVHSDGLP